MNQRVGEALAVVKCRLFASARVWTGAVCIGAGFFLSWQMALGADSRGGSVSSDGDPQRGAEIARLIRDLGASTFMARQHAQRELVALGTAAKPALETASHDPDHEIRQRARSALASIADVDFHVRLGEFVVDPYADDGHGLPGWDRYRSLVGASPAARRLFAEMQRGEHELLEAVGQRPALSGSLLDARCQQLENRTQDADAARPPHYALSTMAALLFAASNPDVPLSDRARKCINGFGSPLNQSLHSRPTEALVRALLNAWVGRPFERDDRHGYGSLLLAMQYDLKGGLGPALALVDPPPVGAPGLEQYAILTIGKLGAREHITSLEPLLADQRSVADRGGRESEVQIRDVALAAMVHLSGQKLADYGFNHAKQNDLYLFNPNTLGFSDPAARDEALTKWRAWREQQKK
ncbi:MAG TPA: hypothetical protein VG125_18670 [Pirellulales bacterium]|nr:hypothetical protein [Pirellulales bacterium]